MELLAPAGNLECALAAFDAGADAVYCGLKRFNARERTENFSFDEMSRLIAYAHRLSRRVYVTFNTLVKEDELDEAAQELARLEELRPDAVIVQDLGVVRIAREYFPKLVLHGSTQMGLHNSAGLAFAKDLGLSRVILERQTTLAELEKIMRTKPPVELEIFIHGALCVCHSGQCLFSSMVGGRSGNRGECAQPCRLPYNGGKYPLSLKDNCLAGHIPELIDAHVASLKIEGRMKGPDYVGPVTAVYRRLLDGHRAATPEEIGYLAEIFSRSGFTDAYFTGNISHAMLGTRTEADKRRSAGRTVPYETKRGLPAVAVPSRAHKADEYLPVKPHNKPVKRRTAYMHSVAQLTPAARKYFDICYLPLAAAADVAPGADGECFIGAALPPVIYDSDMPEIRRSLEKAAGRGIRDLLIGNIGHLGLAREAGMIPHGDFRLNICNRESAAAIEGLGFRDFILSPELTLPRLRDIGGQSLAVVYGRIPLMVTEKCAGKECGGCRACTAGKNQLTDRRGARFPVLREWRHRSLIVNSLPTSMSDRQKALAEYGVRGQHFIFTVETPQNVDAVIRAYSTGTPLPGECRRIAVK